MIRINLLPAELRRGNRLPTKVLAAALGAALATSASIGWFGLVWFGDLAAAEGKLLSVEARLGDREKKVAYVDLLEANQKDYATRVQTILDIGKSRRVWSKFLDELIDVVNNNGDAERHIAWIDSLSVKGDPKKGAAVTMQCSVQGEEQDRLANFHDDLEAAPFGKEVTRSDPVWKRDDDKARLPPVSLRFPLTLQFQPTVKEVPKAKPAPKAPAKK